jgi:hypothetical protein
MRDIEDKIRKAMQMEDPELLEHYRGEQSIPQMVIDSFRSRHRWLVLIVFTSIGGLFLLSLFAAYQFFQIESIREMIAWATIFIFCAIGISMMKVWYWMELNKNSLSREIKRMELELANLSRRITAGGSLPEIERK